MDKNIFKVLDLLSNHIFGSIVDISSIINQIFPYQKGLSEENFEIQKRLVGRFLDGLEQPKFINFNGTRSNIGQYFKNRERWFEENTLGVLITEIGLTAINQAKFNKSIKLNNRRQTLILGGALLISMISLWVAWLNYNATIDISAQKQYLLPSKELIEQLKQKAIIPRSEKIHPIIQGKISIQKGND
ncbi:hypothetical protein HDF24_15220 [Mucilaginibacter sp. X4EP1]|uniref:hypothetical protein n=1 Tax=Mucilaginibacter sp. X4EP1 TaxID=2723092 RepID=UPI00216A87D4|nr:hypothetical protein [Mucilaginibacter sp. X4EP1]MCS3815351.1 hypothetical protein [Mucilaginibacter sp. X4EP1]